MESTHIGMAVYETQYLRETKGLSVTITQLIHRIHSRQHHRAYAGSPEQQPRALQWAPGS